MRAKLVYQMIRVDQCTAVVDRVFEFVLIAKYLRKLTKKIPVVGGAFVQIANCICLNC